MVSRSPRARQEYGSKSRLQRGVRLHPVPRVRRGWQPSLPRLYVRRLGLEASSMLLRTFQPFFICLCSLYCQDLIAEDESALGSMFLPLFLGSDKTTVSVATGQNDYYPLYMSIGNIRNSVRRAHRNGVVLVGFLAVPKCA